ncbi:MAG: metal ABC transporter ATP-binding protein [Actinomycetota bacterium]
MAGGERRTPSREEAAVVSRDAAVVFGDRVVWRDVNIEIASGTFTAILGPNGAGKSTLLKAILGVQQLSAGSLVVLGAPAGRRRARIGYVPQHSGFDPSLHIRGYDIVRLGLDGDRWGIPLPGRTRKDQRARLQQIIDLVGASAYASEPAGRLSGGEQQRLLIAQALVRQPDLLLLDEPLDNLDLSSQVVVSALLQRICRRQGVTIVMVAHDVNPILPYLDHVIYLAAGAAVAGPPAEVITTETLSRLFGASIEVLRAADGRLVVVGQPEAPAYHSERHAP